MRNKTQQSNRCVLVRILLDLFHAQQHVVCALWE
jgi:hypothetical protein